MKAAPPIHVVYAFTKQNLAIGEETTIYNTRLHSKQQPTQQLLQKGFHRIYKVTIVGPGDPGRSRVRVLETVTN